MITVCIAAIHAFGTNGRFRPDLLYLGALVADYHIVLLIVTPLGAQP